MNPEHLDVFSFWHKESKKSVRAGPELTTLREPFAASFKEQEQEEEEAQAEQEEEQARSRGRSSQHHCDHYFKISLLLQSCCCCCCCCMIQQHLFQAPGSTPLVVQHGRHSPGPCEKGEKMCRGREDVKMEMTDQIKEGWKVMEEAATLPTDFPGDDNPA